MSLFSGLTEKDKSKAVEKLISDSTPDRDFFLMIILSILMATFGLLLNNMAVVIGSTLIAPILYSILSLSLGIVMADFKLILRSVYTILKTIAFGVGGAAIATLVFSFSEEEKYSRIITSVEPSFLYIAVAIIAGFAASFALVKPGLNETLPGVAISVALIPPLAAAGIGIAKLDGSIISNSLILFILNIIGIVFASMVNFSLMKFYLERKVAEKTVKKEEARMEKEEGKKKE